MCYYDYCAVVVAVEVDEKRKNIVSCRNVKVACRFIAKNDRGVIDKCPCDSYTLLLTARKLRFFTVSDISVLPFLASFDGRSMFSFAVSSGIRS